MSILRTLFIIAFCGTALAAVVENVAVNTAGAPTNYVVSYHLNIPSGEWYYVDATLSADNGASFPFALDEQPVAAMLTDEPNLPIRIAAQDNGKNINAFFNSSGTQSFSFSVNRRISVPQARLRVVTTQTEPDGAVWEEVTANAPWGARSGHQCVVFNNNIWLVGGSNTNDVWSSSDGTNWARVTAAAPWSARSGHQCVVLNNKIWLLGGGYNDVWSSSDGTNWTQVTAAAPWSARSGHQCVVLDNMIWLLGGDFMIDVWSSSDGTNWTQVTAAAPWIRRTGHECVVFNNKIWLLGGVFNRNDVWSSSDGTNWAQVTAAAPWSGRHVHQCVVFNNKIWLLGGFFLLDNWQPISYYNDVWCSADGITWTRVNAAAPWSSRGYHQCVVFDKRIFLLGGLFSEIYQSYYCNDVWCSPPR